MNGTAVVCANSVSIWSKAMTVGLPVSAISRDMSRTICCGDRTAALSPQRRPFRIVGQVERDQVGVADVLRAQAVRAVQHETPGACPGSPADLPVERAQRRDERVQIGRVSGASPAIASRSPGR